VGKDVNSTLVMVPPTPNPSKSVLCPGKSTSTKNPQNLPAKLLIPGSTFRRLFAFFQGTQSQISYDNDKRFECFQQLPALNTINFVTLFPPHEI